MYRIRNWSQFQHYKTRNPPWVRLYFSLLSSPAWVTLDDASRVLAVASMLLASRSDEGDGSLPSDPEYVRRVAYLNSSPDFKPLIACGFLEYADDASKNASTMLATPPTETETEQSRAEHIEQNRAEPVLLNGRAFKGRKSVAHHHLASSAYEAAKVHSPGWDIYFLERKWREKYGHESADNPDGAFVGFCKKFTGGKPPQ